MSNTSRFFHSIVLVTVAVGVLTSCTNDEAVDSPVAPVMAKSGGGSTCPGVPGKTTGIVVVPGVLSMLVGQTVDLNVTNQAGVTIADCNLKWVTSAASIATVSAAGVVNALAEGSAIVQATTVVARRTLTGTAQVTVSPIPVGSITLSPRSIAMFPGDSSQLVASVVDSGGNPLSGRAIVWTSSDTTIATVSSSGTVKAKAFSGTSTRSVSVTAATGGKSDVAAIVVSPAVIDSIAVSPSTATIPVNGSVQLTSTVFDKYGTSLSDRSVTWASSDASIVAVSMTGIATATRFSGASVRTAMVSATAGGRTSSVTVTVTPAKVASITLSPSQRVLYAGESLQLSAVLKDGEGNTLTDRLVSWTSSNSQVASTTTSGMVTANSLGEVTIIASSDGVNGTASVRIVDQPTITTDGRFPTVAADAGYPADCRMAYDCSGSWSNITGVFGDDASFASVPMPRQSTSCWNCTISRWLHVSGYGFSIPEGSTIRGIRADVIGYSSGPGTAVIEYAHALKGGVRSTEGKRQQLDGYGTVGGPTSLWGESWTAADINGSSFGIGLTLRNIWDYSYTAYVNYIRIAVTYSPPSSALTY